MDGDAKNVALRNIGVVEWPLPFFFLDTEAQESPSGRGRDTSLVMEGDRGSVTGVCIVIESPEIWQVQAGYLFAAVDYKSGIEGRVCHLAGVRLRKDVFVSDMGPCRKMRLKSRYR